MCVAALELGEVVRCLPVTPLLTVLTAVRAAGCG